MTSTVLYAQIIIKVVFYNRKLNINWKWRLIVKNVQNKKREKIRWLNNIGLHYDIVVLQSIYTHLHMSYQMYVSK